MRERSSLDKVCEYFWLFTSRQMQNVLLILLSKSKMLLAKTTYGLPQGLQEKVFANLSRGALATLNEELEILSSKITSKMQLEACEQVLLVVEEMIEDLRIQLPEMSNTLSYYDGEASVLFKDEQVASRRVLESFIRIVGDERMADFLVNAKSQMGGDYLDAIGSLTKDFRKYLLDYLAEEDYQVIVNSFNKDALSTLRPSHAISVRNRMVTCFLQSLENRDRYPKRSLPYQGAVVNDLWWQAYLEWLKVSDTLSDDELVVILMGLELEEVVLLYYESPFKYRERLFSLFGEDVIAIMRHIYREIDLDKLGDEAYQIRVKVLRVAQA
jgi:hypothetical protein